jgi:hypothetical protein
MPSTIHALFNEFIDYAGLFPPARLPLDEAFSRFLAHRSGSDGWMLARFVVPAKTLGSLGNLAVSSTLERPPFRIAVLGAGGDDPPAFAESIDHDVQAMTEFGYLVDRLAVMDVFEVRLPDSGDLAAAVDFASDQLVGALANPITPFFEVPLTGDWRDRIRAGAEAVSSASRETDRHRRAGLKIRCGGLEAAAVPTIDAVAAAVIECRDLALPLKATQGLHHPFRHPDPGLGTTVHGFVNLVAAVLLAKTHDLDKPAVREIIGEEDPTAFVIDGTTFGWRDLAIGADHVSDGRSGGITSIGSCSFTEPRDDLAELGLLR